MSFCYENGSKTLFKSKCDQVFTLMPPAYVFFQSNSYLHSSSQTSTPTTKLSSTAVRHLDPLKPNPDRISDQNILRPVITLMPMCGAVWAPDQREGVDAGCCTEKTCNESALPAIIPGYGSHQRKGELHLWQKFQPWSRCLSGFNQVNFCHSVHGKRENWKTSRSLAFRRVKGSID